MSVYKIYPNFLPFFWRGGEVKSFGTQGKLHTLLPEWCMKSVMTFWEAGKQNDRQARDGCKKEWRGQEEYKND